MSDVIWAVSRGSYSDYGVYAIFSTREAAEAYASRFNEMVNHNEYEVEQFPLNPTSPAENLFLWSVYLHANGDVQSATRIDYAWREQVVRNGQCHRFPGEDGGFTVRCYARDQEHAIKIGGEKRQEM